MTDEQILAALFELNLERSSSGGAPHLAVPNANPRT